MVCPYCNNHPIPNSAVCNHCGIILKMTKGSRKPSKPKQWRRIFSRIGWYAISILLVGVLGFVAGWFVFDHRLEMAILCAAGGAVLGALIAYGVSAGRTTFQAARLNARRRKLQGQIHTIEQANSKLLEGSDSNKKAKASDGSGGSNGDAELGPDARLQVATVQLIAGEIDESLQQLEQIYRLGHGSRVDFLNNCGVAFAKRGQVQLSLDRFTQAIHLNPDTMEPRVNLVYSLMQTGHGDAIRKVLAEQNGTLEAAAREHPGVAGRIGLTHALAGNVPNAQQFVEREINSEDRLVQADAHNNLGIIKAMAGQPREALSEFTQALRLDSGHAAALANTGALYYKRGRFDEAAQLMESGAQVDPHNGLIHTQLGAAYCRMNYVNEGIREFREARLHDQALFEPNYNLGKAYIEHDILDEAERCLTRAYEINPYAWQILVAQATLLFKLNNIERAMSAYQQANQVHPDEPVILVGIALCATLSGDYELAENYLNRALSFSSNDMDMLTTLSWHYLVRSDVQHANEVLERIKDSEYKSGPAYNNMGLCQLEMGAYDAAEQYFNKALQFDPYLHSVHYNLGCDFISQKAISRAVRAWEKAKTVEQGNADLHTNLGVAYYKEEKFEPASMEFRRVLHLRQENAMDYAYLGLALARLKRHKEAIQQFEQALEIEPRNPMLHSNLGLAYYFGNQVEEAMKEWQIVTQIDRKYAMARAAKQQSEYDDSLIEFIPLYISERALYSPPKVPDFIIPFVPGYRTSRWELIISDPDVRRLDELKLQQDAIDRSLRALKLT